jgi:superfamily II DNA or RNA helicase
MSIHPITTTARIRKAYISYLKTIKPFQDARLRQEFSNALEEENMLVKGPYIELTPPFAQGKSPQQLIHDGQLCSRFEIFCHNDGGFLPDRPLYCHQEEAIYKVAAGRNIVITTGTGSGKTESFLIPILDMLAREEKAGTISLSGVRALLLYPLNALANDQMDRLRGYLKYYPQIKFGRYVGETKHTEKDALDHYLQINGYEPPENELISRSQIQSNPPHILLTNYAMLEYLLLRPVDTKLFDGETGRHWHFIILDEAHAYDGAQATEIAMLLRRLQDRVTDNGQKKLQVIATSATLGEGVKSLPQIVDFAKELFALNFEPEDIIFGKRFPESGLDKTWGKGAPNLYTALESLVETWRAGNDTFLPESLPGIPPSLCTKACQTAEKDIDQKVPRFVYELLKGDENVHALRKVLLDKPLPLKDAAARLFEDLTISEAQNALTNLVSLALIARERYDKAALLPARYHLFARALEGAFVCLNSRHLAHTKAGEPLLFLTRRKFCPSCHSRVFELANCTRCGESYLIGEERFGSDLSEKETTDSIRIQPNLDYLIQSSAVYDSDIAARNVQYFVLKSLDSTLPDEDALIEGDAEADEKADEKSEEMEICPRCGAIYQLGLFTDRCGCGIQPLKISRVVMGQRHTLKRCVSCSTFSNSGVIYRFLTGQDAPVSVLASTLYSDIPAAKGPKERQYPGQGRKMLIFTDNRQRAAFFAPYLQHAQNRQMRRRLMIESLANLREEEPLRFSDWMDILLTQAKKSGIFGEFDSLREKRLTIATWLMQEFSGLDKRLSLEGVGLLYFRPLRPQNWQPPSELLCVPWKLSPQGSFDMVALLLNSLRRQGAVSYLLEDEDIHLLDTEKQNEFRPRARLFYIHQSQASSRGKFGVYSWLPASKYNNNRLDFLVRFLARKKEERQPSAETRQQAHHLLEALWRYLTSVNGSLWLQTETKDRLGTLYRLRHDRWEVIPTIDAKEGWCVCNTCQNLSPFSVGSVCPTYGCKGILQPLTDHLHIVEDNLYRHQYLDEAPLPLKAQEHTAQWKADKAAEVQKEFITGKINALSCSTTFEMGVDVGDLNAVILRNMPPTTANYIQRAGRAGRRSDSVAIAVTFAQRRPHDLTFYAEPERMISGKIRPPIVSLKNDKIIRRHLHSVVFAAFFRWVKNTYNLDYRYCGDFFAPDQVEQNGPALLDKFLQCRLPSLQQALLRIVPEDEQLRQLLALENWEWLTYLIKNESAVLDKAAADILGELEEFHRVEQKAASERNYRLAEDAQKIQTTIRKRDLLGYLGSKNVLPKYGFPTDVVTLQTDHLNLPMADAIQLERDLKIAISEFAPGGQVVAAGKIWYSRAIRRLPDRSWEPHGYAVCPTCKRINIQTGQEMPRECQCGQPLHTARQKGIYITPEYGFLADDHTDTPGDQPPEQIYASRVYLAAYRASSRQPFDPQNILPDINFTAGVQVLKGYTRYAYLALVNDGYGSGFNVCPTCGYASVIDYSSSTSRKRKDTDHNNPTNHQKCTDKLVPYHLGHHFMTDVLQLRFSLSIQQENAIYSLLYAILSGASDALDIPRDDIDGVIFFQDGQPSFLLYDTTPGGSGHVKMIDKNLSQALDGAYKRVSKCEGCGKETSCYSCLRSYRNQFIHDKLERGLAEEILARVLGKTIE